MNGGGSFWVAEKVAASSPATKVTLPTAKASAGTAKGPGPESAKQEKKPGVERKLGHKPEPKKDKWIIS